MAMGIVYNFNHDNGYGFIRPNNNNDAEVSVHVTELAKAGINVCNKVHLKRLISYDVTIGGDNKKRAVNIKIINDATN